MHGKLMFANTAEGKVFFNLWLEKKKNGKHIREHYILFYLYNY